MPRKPLATNPFTYERLLADAGFRIVEDTKKALTRVREALDADKGTAPDHPVRLSAADRIFTLGGLEQRREEPNDAGRPVNVAIILTGADPRAAVQDRGVTIHLAGDDPGADR